MTSMKRLHAAPGKPMTPAAILPPRMSAFAIAVFAPALPAFGSGQTGSASDKGHTDTSRPARVASNTDR